MLKKRFLFIVGLITSCSLYALPFSITPASGTTLPTHLIPGQTATALYTVSNNTSTVRSTNYVKYLPPHVTQVTSDPTYPDLCGPTFTLNPRGTIGSSCTLELQISGAVDANDPNPHHHLFVCFPGGITCAGTPNPLNVLSATPTFFSRAYVANFGTNSISLCSVNAGTGELELCTDLGIGVFFNSPLGIALNPAGSRFYGTDFGGSTVSACSVDRVTGTLSGCANVDGDGSAIFAAPSYIAFNASGTQAYVSNLGGNAVSLCSVNLNTGQFAGCADTGSGFSFPVGLNLTTGGTRAYVANAAIGTTVSLCAVDAATGALSGCADSNGDGTATFVGPAFLAFNSATTRVYVSDNAGGGGTLVSLCSVNLVTGTLNNCQDSGADVAFSSPASVNLNAAETLLYIANQAGTTVTQCSVNATTGLLSGCIDSNGDGSAAFSGPSGMILE